MYVRSTTFFDSRTDGIDGGPDTGTPIYLHAQLMWTLNFVPLLAGFGSVVLDDVLGESSLMLVPDAPTAWKVKPTVAELLAGKSPS